MNIKIKVHSEFSSPTLIHQIPGRHRHRWCHCWVWCESGPPPSWGPPGPALPCRQPPPRGACWPPSGSVSCRGWPLSCLAVNFDNPGGRNEECGRRLAWPSLKVGGDCHHRMEELRPGERRGWRHKTRHQLWSRHISPPEIQRFDSANFQLLAPAIKLLKYKRGKF